MPIVVLIVVPTVQFSGLSFLQVKEAYYCNNNCVKSPSGECLKCWIDKGQRPAGLLIAQILQFPP
jgi:hypothetical protein